MHKTEGWGSRLYAAANIARTVGGKPKFDVPNSIMVKFDTPRKAAEYAVDMTSKYNLRVDIRESTVLLWEHALLSAYELISNKLRCKPMMYESPEAELIKSATYGISDARGKLSRVRQAVGTMFDSSERNLLSRAETSAKVAIDALNALQLELQTWQDV